jgi:hypothetical protein
MEANNWYQVGRSKTFCSIFVQLWLVEGMYIYQILIEVSKTLSSSSPWDRPTLSCLLRQPCASWPPPVGR